LNRALLVLHSPQDQTVGIENAAKLFKGAKHPKSFVTLDGADHLLTQKEDSLYAGSLIASWAARYIIQAEDSAPFSEMRVAAQTESYYFTDIKAGQFNISADRPKRMGGNEMAPSPYDLLMSSLASSTSMTIRYGADDMKREVSSIKVHLEPKKKEQGVNSEKIQLLTINRIIEVKGDLEETEIRTMASRCPVYRIVKKGLRIETEIVKK
jgi:putative redox protein